MVSAKSSCRDITCESVPGSPLPFLFLSGRGESLGTRLMEDCLLSSCEGYVGFAYQEIDNFTISKRLLMKCNCYVTSHPEYTPCPTWSTFPLKSVLNIGEFEIRALVSRTVFSNKTIVNQLSARL